MSAQLTSEQKLAKFTRENWPCDKVRQTFMDYFCKKMEHKFIPSSPILPHDDPTLLFANSGMNQFKPCFLDQIPESHQWKGMKRAANSQKCLRAGGKHNDLEEVGFDVYHHTFFEMLGNWSFGDYFKEEAITWSWELLTEVYGIPGDRLYATYFGGDPSKPGVPADTEARDIWLRYLPANRVLPFNAKDNFWEMGATGPCGPCTEIHFDRIGNREVPELVNMDDPDVLEIWNNVFMQFNCDINGKLDPLPMQCVDTGMGFERLTSCLQNVRSNYDTDIFDGIFKAIQADTGARAYSGLVGAEDTDGIDMAYRVVADHIRALTFAITDFIDPDADGRGYVLRRILRRGIRYANQFLGAKPGFFSRLSSVVVSEMKGFFPELAGRHEHVARVLLEEETAFNKTLAKGLKRYAAAVEDVKDNKMDASVACELYTTYGFPLDLTRVMCDERKIILDEAACEKELEKQREISKQGAATDGNVLKLNALQSDYLKRNGVEGTDDLHKYEWKSVGEGQPLPGCTVKAIFVGLNSEVEHEIGFVQQITGADRIGLILDKTSYYAEAGGQIYDIGTLTTSDGVVFNVVDTQKNGAHVLHIGTLESKDSSITVGATVTASVDYARRALTAKNHTATHVLNFALRDVLGETDQRGSLCDPDKLRFDFSYGKAVKPAELARIENIVQSVVDQKQTVDKLSVPFADAKEIDALRSVFGEKYPSTVRVVAVAPLNSIQAMIDAPKDKKWFDYSIEFCGGTHLDNVGECNKFILVSEEGTSRGVRRITGLTAGKAQEAIATAEGLTKEFADAAQLDGRDLQAAIKKLTLRLEQSVIGVTHREALNKSLKALVSKVKKWKKKYDQTLEKAAVASAEAVAADSKDAKFLVLSFNANGSSKVLQKAGKTLAKALPNTPFLLYSVEDGDGSGSMCVLCEVPKSIATLKANEWANTLVGACGGKAGGKAACAAGAARSGSNSAEGVQAAIKFAEAWSSNL